MIASWLSIPHTIHHYLHSFAAFFLDTFSWLSDRELVSFWSLTCLWSKCPPKPPFFLKSHVAWMLQLTKITSTQSRGSQKIIKNKKKQIRTQPKKQKLAVAQSDCWLMGLLVSSTLSWHKHNLLAKLPWINPGFRYGEIVPFCVGIQLWWFL